MVMFQMPAVCDQCGRAFNSGIAGSNSTNIRMSGNRSGPCPSCGGMGTVPDGVYNISERGWELVERLPGTRDELLRAAGIIQEVLAEQHKRSGAPPDINLLAERLRQETNPGLGDAILEVLRDQALQNVLGILALLVMLLGRG